MAEIDADKATITMLEAAVIWESVCTVRKLLWRELISVVSQSIWLWKFSFLLQLFWNKEHLFDSILKWSLQKFLCFEIPIVMIPFRFYNHQLRCFFD
jgi:hypothetical protein